MKLYEMDCAVLKSDSFITKFLKRKILKTIGFYFRKRNFKKLINK